MPQQIFNTKLTDVVTSTTAAPRQAKEPLGSIRWQGNKCYKYVKLDNDSATVASVANDPVAYKAATGHSINTVVSDVTDADAVEVLAGTLQAACAGLHTGGTVYYLWIQIKGSVVINQAIAGTTPADGEVVCMDNLDETLDLRAAAEQDTFAVCQSVTGKLIILDCPF